MPVIMEVDEDSILAHEDFSQLLDLPETAFAGSNEDVIGSTETAEALHPTHQDSNECLSHGFMGDWDLPEQSIDPYGDIEEPDYTIFENFIPRFTRPEKPCDYCRIRRLNCYITRGEGACTPCNLLFRECSLTNTQTLEGLNAGTGYLLDTLHVVDEDTAKVQGSLTGIKQLRSKGRASGTSTPVRLDDEPGSSKRNGIRFPRHAVKTLRDWLDVHADNPYPTEEEKAELQQKTELKSNQIANWLANARRRRKATDKVKPKGWASPSLRPSTVAIDIPAAAEKPWDELNPLERWKNSPPENEPASITDIAHAVENTELPDDGATSPSSYGARHRSSAGSGFSNARAPSTTSFETGQTSSKSASTALSHGSSHSHGSFGSFSSSLAGKKDRRRRRKPTQTSTRKLGEEKKRIFQCTFCTDTFKSKYDWTRHEKSLHLSLEKWICAPLGPVIADPATGNEKCMYCDAQNANRDHLETHNHSQCEEKGLDARTFYRKDHLRQHLRLMHNCEMTPFMDNWRFTAVSINSRCGFCTQRFKVWQERVDHLTAHFKAGARMSEWKGCRGLDPAVAAQVTNAMPPYLIGIESVSPNPFSASNKATWRQLAEGEQGDKAPDLGILYSGDIQAQLNESESMSTKATCWEILTVRLGKYANEMAQKGVVLTDDMLQTQARRILYDTDDAWNQTAADNPEWLDLFKKAHGLDFIPTAVGGQGEQVPEDLETYGDLGLRVPFAVQLQAYNQSQADGDLGNYVPSGVNRAVGEKTKSNLRVLYGTLAKEGVLHDENGKCKHTECTNNIIDVSAIDGRDAQGSKHRRWCTYEVPPEKAKRFATTTAPVTDSGSLGAVIQTAGVEEEESRRTANVSQGLQSLFDMDERLSQQFDPREAEPFRSWAKHFREAPPPMIPDPSTGVLNKKPFLQRHRYELPKDRATRFATTTGAWQDSGLMPEPVPTSPPSIENHDFTSTGAMMEFLGGDLGQILPFSSDAATSTIPLTSTPPGGFDWAIPSNPEDEAVMIQELDKLIAASTAGQAQQAMTAGAFPSMTVGADVQPDLAMQDFDFDDMEMTFDGVFDMPMDETFVPTSNA